MRNALSDEPWPRNAYVDPILKSRLKGVSCDVATNSPVPTATSPSPYFLTRVQFLNLLLRMRAYMAATEEDHVRTVLGYYRTNTVLGVRGSGHAIALYVSNTYCVLYDNDRNRVYEYHQYKDVSALDAFIEDVKGPLKFKLFSRKSIRTVKSVTENELSIDSSYVYRRNDVFLDIFHYGLISSMDANEVMKMARSSKLKSKFTTIYALVDSGLHSKQASRNPLVKLNDYYTRNSKAFPKGIELSYALTVNCLQLSIESGVTLLDENHFYRNWKYYMAYMTFADLKSIAENLFRMTLVSPVDETLYQLSMVGSHLPPQRTDSSLTDYLYGSECIEAQMRVMSDMEFREHETKFDENKLKLLKEVRPLVTEERYEELASSLTQLRVRLRALSTRLLFWDTTLHLLPPSISYQEWVHVYLSPVLYHLQLLVPYHRNDNHINLNVGLYCGSDCFEGRLCYFQQYLFVSALETLYYYIHTKHPLFCYMLPLSYLFSAKDGTADHFVSDASICPGESLSRSTKSYPCGSCEYILLFKDVDDRSWSYEEYPADDVAFLYNLLISLKEHYWAECDTCNDMLGVAVGFCREPQGRSRKEPGRKSPKECICASVHCNDIGTA